MRLCAELSEMPEYAPAMMRRVDPTDDVLTDDDALDNWLLCQRSDAAPFVWNLQDGAVVRSDGGCVAAVRDARG